MAVKIVLLRKVPLGKEEALTPLLIQLRQLCMERPGYVSGETLMNMDDPEEYLVLSTWASISNWNKWLASEERIAIQEQIDELLGIETQYQVYYNA